MKKSKSSDTKVNLFYIASVLFYLAAILTFIFGEDSGTGVMWLCFGSAFLCIASAFRMKYHKDDDDENK